MHNLLKMILTLAALQPTGPVEVHLYWCHWCPNAILSISAEGSARSLIQLWHHHRGLQTHNDHNHFLLSVGNVWTYFVGLFYMCKIDGFCHCLIQGTYKSGKT